MVTDPTGKLDYCLECIAAVQDACCFLTDDSDKRLISRVLFLRLDDFTRTAPQVKNDLRRRGKDVRQLEVATNRLLTDYGGHYDRIRDHLTAHRDDLGIGVTIDLWRDIDTASISILASDAADIAAQIAARDTAYVINPQPAPAGLEDALRQPAPRTAGAYAHDTLAATRTGEIAVSSPSPLGRAASLVVSGFDFANRELQLLQQVAGLNHRPLERVLKSLLVLDVLNIAESLTDVPGRSPRPGSLLTQVEVAKMAATLRAVARQVPTADWQALIEIRNKCAAHLDEALTAADIVARIDALDVNLLVNLLRILAEAFEVVCRSDVRLKGFRLHGVPLPLGVSVAPRSPFPSF
jgi:hypothetical protein